VCGDTLSDLPLVSSAKRMNPDGTYAVFVDPTAEVQTQLEEMLAADHICIVSSPPVLQCGMMKAVMLIRKSFPWVLDGMGIGEFLELLYYGSITLDLFVFAGCLIEPGWLSQHGQIK